MSKDIKISADRKRLQELANCEFTSEREASTFFMGMVMTGLWQWFKEERTKEDEIILTDTLAALMYVITE